MASVIIVDDDRSLRDVLADLLASAGHAVRTASSGRSALQEFDRLPADLVVTDIMMDDGDGIEVIQTLRQNDLCPRIIAISGKSGREGVDYLNLARKFGADFTLAKPFRAGDLLNAIAACLKE